MRHELRLFWIALQFLTRLPVPAWVGHRPEWLNQSARHFPAVGVLVGGVGAAVLGLTHGLFGAQVGAWACIGATVFLTGAFHEDGWADTCDGLGGAVSSERALEIMKDSRIGAYGAIGLVLMLSLKASALAALPLGLAMALSVLAHSASRAAAVALMRALPYAGDADHAKAKPLAQQVSNTGVAVALAWPVGVGLVLLLWQPTWWPVLLAGALAMLGVGLGCARWLRRRLGGFTGDTLGATQQLVELGLLLAGLAAVRW